MGEGDTTYDPAMLGGPSMGEGDTTYDPAMTMMEGPGPCDDVCGPTCNSPADADKPECGECAMCHGWTWYADRTLPPAGIFIHGPPPPGTMSPNNMGEGDTTYDPAMTMMEGPGPCD